MITIYETKIAKLIENYKMALFEVKGWDLKNKEVASEVEPSKKKKKKSKKNDSVDLKDIKSPLTSDKKPVNKDKMEKKKHKPTKTDKTEEKDKRDVPNKKQKPTQKETETSSLSNEVNEPPSKKASSKLTPLQQKMMAKLSGSRFRWINEQLYTINSEDALQLVKDEPSLFDEYHQGFREQVHSWPENPVDVFVNQIQTRGSSRPVNAPGGLPGIVNDGRKQVVIADMGCGEAQLAKDVNSFVAQHNKKKKRGGLDIKVHSFDLKKVNERITVADIKNVPLPDNSCSIVVFCLALMGTNFLDFIKEAHRILAPRGELWIAEIKSRFTESADARTTKSENVGQEFVDALKLSGFFHKNTDNTNKMFSRFEFFKPSADIIEERRAKLERKRKFIEHESEKEDLEAKRSKNPEGNWLLKPCIYKRR